MLLNFEHTTVYINSRSWDILFCSCKQQKKCHNGNPLWWHPKYILTAVKEQKCVLAGILLQNRFLCCIVTDLQFLLAFLYLWEHLKELDYFVNVPFP